MDNKFLQKSLENFAKQVIKQSRSNLTRKDKNVTKELYNSLDYDIKISPNSFQLSLNMDIYGQFQDKGVSGKDKKYDTPYSYKNKRPPTKPLIKWIKDRGIRFRNKKGRFIKDTAAGFILSNSIFHKGIKPSLFFTKAFENSFERLPEDIIELYSLEIDKFLKASVNNI